jgi:hypothetical protein
MRHLILPYLLLATACSPYLQYHPDQAHAYGFTAPCGQGPFTVTTRLSGARWGEKLEIAGFAPHAVVGQYAIRLDGKAVTSGTFATERLVQNGTYTTLQPDQHPQNARCVERPEVVAAQQPVGWQPQPQDWQAPPQPVLVAPPTMQPPAPVPIAQLVSLAPDVFVAEGDRNLKLTSFTWASVDDIGTPRVRADAQLEITLWSQEPNDWEGAIVQLVHEVAEPSVPDAEYIAYLRKERREAELAAQKRQAEAQAAQQKRQERCTEHHEDEDCWGKGGYDAYVKAYYAPRRVQTQTPRQVTQPTAPPPHAPDGPPPVAQSEAPPPQPSQHAEWISGYWQWTGLTWFWLGGWWKVPEADWQATVLAPVPPPPRVAELHSPPPLPGAVWLAGAWYWQDETWRWHPGQWTLPPQPGLAWQAPNWVLHGRGVQLVPGAWGHAVRLP